MNAWIIGGRCHVWDGSAERQCWQGATRSFGPRDAGCRRAGGVVFPPRFIPMPKLFLALFTAHVFSAPNPVPAGANPVFAMDTSAPAASEPPSLFRGRGGCRARQLWITSSMSSGRLLATRSMTLPLSRRAMVARCEEPSMTRSTPSVAAMSTMVLAGSVDEV